MKICISFLALLLMIGIQASSQAPALIPAPLSLQMDGGSFSFSTTTVIVYEKPSGLQAAEMLNAYLKKHYGFQLAVRNNLGRVFKRPESVIWIAALPMRQSLTNEHEGIPEYYRIAVQPDGVFLNGNPMGLLRGVSTLLQLLPTEPKWEKVEIPGLKIEDKPRFAYRGLHLDAGRHFQPVSFVKKYIDYLFLHKYNYFHWHLTEDQGWRIEIKKYPKLTSIGACRNGTIIGRYPGKGNDGQRHCGFYTQKQIREVVKYAADRGITVIPEIEMPGHSSAALAAYPELGCTGGPYKVQETWGVFNDVYCAGNEKTYTFLEDVLKEAMALFPSSYIHVGGDECPKASWKKCAKCQKRMKEKGLKDEHELQSYFIQRMEKFLNQNGRTLIGWDEILEGGLAPNAIVMSWRGEDGGIAAAKQGHQVIMTPGSHVYLDHSQTRNEDSVTIGGYTNLEKIYSYEPVPAVLSEKEAGYVLGAQGNVWTEYMRYPSKIEYMIFPRASALSEVLWSPKQSRNWSDFEKRLPALFHRYDLWRVNYSRAYMPKPQ